MNLKINEISCSEVFRGKAFSVVRESFNVDQQHPMERDTVTHSGAVVILPLLSPSHAVILKQYRHSVRRVLWEFPAGTLNIGEDPLACAKRELTEETGYAAKTWCSLGKLFPAPGFCSELQYLFIATDLTPGRQDLDHDEMIQVETLDFDTIEKMILSSEICDAKSICVYFRAKLSKHMD